MEEAYDADQERAKASAVYYQKVGKGDLQKLEGEGRGGGAARRRRIGRGEANGLNLVVLSRRINHKIIKGNFSSA